MNNKNTHKVLAKNKSTARCKCADFKTSGFKITGDNSLAFISLKVALSRYFSTYKDLRIFAKHNSVDISKNPKYYEIYSEVIVHFQHFFELIMKDLLRSENELFAAKISKNSGTGFEVLVHLSKQEPIPPKLSEELMSIEFDEALHRLAKIEIKDPRRQKIQALIIKNKEAMETLNTLRNRTWHRGIYFLSSDQLDTFICKCIFPVLIEIQKANHYKLLMQYLPYAQKAGINVISELIKCHKKPKLNTSRVNLLKEIGRSTYESPLSNYYNALKLEKGKKRKIILSGKSMSFSKSSGLLRFRTPNDGERFAHVLATEKQSDLVHCPVCGRKTLILVCEQSDEGFMTETYTPEAECKTCSFHIFDDIDLKLKPFKIPNYFINKYE